MAEHPNDQQLMTWDGSTRGHERAAAVIARWARGKPKWEMVPTAEVLGIDAPQATVTMALNMLTRLEVLVKDGDGYFVAIG
jgi:hypothetical protein